jgi:hypothetical protein
MNNLHFSIDNNFNESFNHIIDYDSIKNDLNNDLSYNYSIDNYITELDKYSILYDDYFNNFTVKYLRIIADFYKLKKPKTKHLLIDSIINFEINPNNFSIVNRKNNMFSCINQLSNDSFFSKFILF